MSAKNYPLIAVLVLVLSQVGSNGKPAHAHTYVLAEGGIPIRMTEWNTQAVFPLLHITSLEAGYFYTCALTAGGGVKCWGWNDVGQLGDGTTTDRYIPVDVSSLASGVVALAAGGAHTCALTAGGGVKCWGYNESGRLGDGTTDNHHTPVDVIDLMSGVTALSAGGAHTCALTSGGGVKCWGWNMLGQLGDGTYTDQLVPVDVSGLASGVVALVAGGGHTCALMASGGVKCWGDNFYGQLGGGANIKHNTPVDVNGLASGVAALAAGNDHTCALLASGGVKCWGWNGHGNLGDGTMDNHSTPVQVSDLVSGVAAVVAGGSHTCALMASSRAKCWGNNHSGQLGDGTNSIQLTPTDVKGLPSEVTALAAGYSHTCALMESGVVKCWGNNYYGQLGDGTTTNHNIPVFVIDPASIVGIVYLPTNFKSFCPDFFDDFSNPSSGWFSGEDDVLRAEYLNGEYRVLVKQTESTFVFRAPACDRQNNVVEVDGRWGDNPGASYGLIFGIFGDFNQFYSYEVNTDYQEFALFRYDYDHWVEITFSHSPAIHAGKETNHLKATREGSAITLEVNGTELGTWYDYAISGSTGAGLIVSSYSDLPNADARFDNFKITRYGSSTISSTSGKVATIELAPPSEDSAFNTRTSKGLYRQIQRKGNWR